jgi:hypothetical protein
MNQTVSYPNAKSTCRCGHLGDGKRSDHEARFSEGHGACKVAGCKCVQFTWATFTPEFKAHRAKRTTTEKR